MGRDPDEPLSSDSETANERKAGERRRALAEGDILGRYTITAFIGGGGMGEVYLAHDPELERDVAIKVLRTDIGGTSMEARGRFLREAQAMARLSHPNVIVIHDTGTVGEQVFVAMERLGGQPLSDWMQESRDWREIVSVFVAAGRGLSAAHRAGIVHRDFKPHNVMVDGDRVVVLDFGLARRADEIEPVTGETPISLSVPLTLTGDLLGTPAYMAPEQLVAGTATERSDQYSFCVSLYEALWGVTPFPGATVAELIAARLRGPRPPPPGRRVPGWLARLVLRGLDLDPQRRHASMDVLVAGLARDRGRRVRTLLVAGGAAALAAGVAIAATAVLGGADPCAAAATGLAGVWDDAARARLREPFAALGSEFGMGTFTRTAERLDAHAAAWTKMRVEACTATLERGEQSAALMDLRMACLDRRRGELDGLVHAFSVPLDAETAGAAINAAAHLPPVGLCADAQALGTRVPVPEEPGARRAVAELEDWLAPAESMVAAANRDAVRAGLGPAIVGAGFTYAPLRARSLLLLADERRVSEDHHGEAALLERAVREAVDGRDDVLAARAWVGLVRARRTLGELRPAVELELAADAAVRRAGDDAALRVTLETELSEAFGDLDLFDQAHEHARRAVARARSVPGGEALLASALAAAAEGHLAARTRSEIWLPIAWAALHEAERAFGPRHYALAIPLILVAKAHAQAGMLDVAEAHLTNAMSIVEGSIGPESRVAAFVHVALGNLDVTRHRYARARQSYERAVAIGERRLGPNHLFLATPLLNLSRVLAFTGDLDGARAALERTRKLLAIQLPPTNHRFAMVLMNLGLVASMADHWDEALAHYLEALRVYEQAYAREDAGLAQLLGNCGMALIAVGRPAEAIPYLERALRIATGDPRNPLDAARLRVELATALDAARRDPARAVALMRDAHASFVAAGEKEYSARAATFLARHRVR